MGIYSDDEIYGIKWTKYDPETDKPIDVYEFKSNTVLVNSEIEEIKNNFEKIDLLEITNYSFQVYKSFTSTLDVQPVTYSTWSSVSYDFLNTFFKSH